MQFLTAPNLLALTLSVAVMKSKVVEAATPAANKITRTLKDIVLVTKIVSGRNLPKCNVNWVYVILLLLCLAGCFFNGCYVAYIFRY